MNDGHMRQKFETLGKPAAPEQGRRRALNAATKKARARLYAGEIALDTAQRECTQTIRDKPPEEWGPALDAYESAVAVYITATAALPASPKE